MPLFIEDAIQETTISTSGVSAEFFPVFNNDGLSTLIQWNPIYQNTQGTSFRTHSVFANDVWRLTDRISMNLGADRATLRRAPAREHQRGRAPVCRAQLVLTYRLGTRLNVGAAYTLSRVHGNFDGENSTSGPVSVTPQPSARQATFQNPGITPLLAAMPAACTTTRRSLWSWSSEFKPPALAASKP